ncbi:MAG: ABC transporter ATP-binding protein [bacterium]
MTMMRGPGGLGFGGGVTQVPPPVGRQTFARVVGQFRPYRRQVAVVAAIIVVTSALGVVNPILIKVVFDTALFVPGGPNLGRLGVLVAIMAVLPLVTGVLGLGQTYYTTLVGQRVMRDLRAELYAHLQKLSLSFFTGTRTGEIQSRLANDVGGVQSVLTNTASSVLSNVVIFVSSLIAMVVISWQLTVVSVITVPVFFWLTKIVGERRRKVAAATQEALADMSAITQETLSVSGVLLSKLFGRQPQELQRYSTKSEELAGLEVRQQMIGQSFFTAVQVFLSLTPAAIYLLAGILLSQGSAAISAGTIVSFTTLQTRLYFPIGSLLQVAVELRSSLALFDRIYAYLDLKPDIEDAPDAVDLAPEEMHGRVELRHVTFSYPAAEETEDSPDEVAGPPVETIDVTVDVTVEDVERPPAMRVALDDVSLVVEPGQLAAFVGASGAGKTTLSYLVPRLYEVTSGAVLLDGHDVRRLTSRSIAGLVGYVTQESYLFHATVRENLLYGRPDADQADLEAAARAAFIHDRIMEFADGYDTVVGERGYRLSGGEKQRLAIARVLLHDPRVLILDEATSALDTTSERIVQQALDPLMSDRTTLAIAHRLSTIIAADVIFVLDRGRIIESGDHATLLAADGAYATLYHEQFGDGRVESRCADGLVLADGSIAH